MVLEGNEEDDMSYKRIYLTEAESMLVERAVARETSRMVYASQPDSVRELRMVSDHLREATVVEEVD